MTKLGTISTLKLYDRGLFYLSDRPINLTSLRAEPKMIHLLRALVNEGILCDNYP